MCFVGRFVCCISVFLALTHFYYFLSIYLIYVYLQISMFKKLFVLFARYPQFLLYQLEQKAYLVRPCCWMALNQVRRVKCSLLNKIYKIVYWNTILTKELWKCCSIWLVLFLVVLLTNSETLNHLFFIIPEFLCMEVFLWLIVFKILNKFLFFLALISTWVFSLSLV